MLGNSEISCGKYLGFRIDFRMTWVILSKPFQESNSPSAFILIKLLIKEVKTTHVLQSFLSFQFLNANPLCEPC